MSRAAAGAGASAAAQRAGAAPAAAGAGASSAAGDVVGLRPLTAHDLPVLDRLERELFGPAAWSPAMLAEEIAGPDRWYVAAVERTPLGGGTVVGYAGLWFDGVDAQVMTIGVAAGRQGRGLGGRLLGALLDRARELRAASVLLEVRVDNEPALALYRRFGFVTLGRRRGYYQPENADAWTMRLDLDMRLDPDLQSEPDVAPRPDPAPRPGAAPQDAAAARDGRMA